VRAFGREWPRSGHFSADDVAVRGDPIAKRRQQVRQQDEAIALGEQRQQFAHGRQYLRAHCDLRNRRLLAGYRDRRVQQHFLERRMLAEQRDEVGELAVSPVEIDRFVQRYLEQRSGIAGAGCLVRHDVRASRAARLAKSFTSEFISFADKPRQGTALRAGNEVHSGSRRLDRADTMRRHGRGRKRTRNEVLGGAVRRN
jgi:hypothetical protein